MGDQAANSSRLLLRRSIDRKAEENRAIAKRPSKGAPERSTGPRSNEDIMASQVHLIDENGENRGVLTIDAALGIARAAGLDLVEVSPNAEPPICKILDLGKFKYQAQKKAAEARKKQKVIEIKEIKLRPNIDTHDYETKMKSMRRFFEQGDKVKFTIRFRGREMAHKELGRDLLDRVQKEAEEVAKVELAPK
jgi:translation initiation factor IF-3